MQRTVDMVEARIPREIEVLYPFWRYGTTEPGVYKPWKRCRKKYDCIWGWAPHPDLRRGGTTKACRRAFRRFGVRVYRPPGKLAFRRDVVPVRMWTGRRYRWFWLTLHGKRD